MDVKDILNEEKEIGEMIEKAKSSPEEMQKFESHYLDVLKKEMDLIFLKSIQTLYFYVKNNNIAKARAIIKGDLVEPQNLDDFYNNLKILKNECDSLKGAFSNASGAAKIVLGGGSDFDNYNQARRDFQRFVNDLFDFVGSACELSRQAKVKNGRMYLKTATHTLSNMSSTLRNMTQYVQQSNRFSEEVVESLKNIKLFFDTNLSIIFDYYVQLKYEDKKRKDAEIAKSKFVDESKVLKSAPIQKDLERLESIKAANELFDRFKVDFMRDLEKEVSMLNRDSYETLINKVERFLTKFPMPLSNDVSLGMATEAQAQINKFIDTVYEISRNTYTPVVFNRE